MQNTSEISTARDGESPLKLFTAAEIAAALGCTKRAILMSLAGVPATGTKVSRGQQNTKAWPLDTLPAILRVRLEHQAQRQNFRNVEALLGALSASPQRAAQPEPRSEQRDLHADLASSFSDYLTDRKLLTPQHREWVWAETIRHFEASLCVAPESESGALKSSLVETLLREVPGLVSQAARYPARALRRDFERKLVAFKKGGRNALRDGRETRSGNYRPVLCPACWEKFTALDVKFGGNESLAWRELKKSGLMCQDCSGRHKFDPRQDKSRVPHSVRCAITPLVDAATPWVKSESAGRMAGPYIPRDWSDTEPGDYFVGDDVTWNHEVFEIDEQGRVMLFRPECIYMADERSSYPLAFLLIAGHYNGRHIRQCMLSVHDELGLPHKGWRYENGIWRSRIVRDESREGWIDFRETEDGFRTMGSLFSIRHALPRNPRSKTVEGDFRILQERMRAERGFVGFNEREEKSDAQKDLRRRVLSEKEDPRNGYLSFAEWGKRISAIVEEFSNEPQNGARNHGCSPAESWKEAMGRRPLRKLPEEARWILATHRQVKRVTPTGLILEYGKNQKWTYADERLARFLGRQVWVHYHLDCPDLVTICDYKKTECFSVKGIRLPANTATSEQLGAAQRQIAGFNRVAKTIAGTLRHPLIATITRDSEFSRAERDLGSHMEEAKAEYRETSRRHADARKLRQRQGLEELREAFAEARQEEDRPIP